MMRSKYRQQEQQNKALTFTITWSGAYTARNPAHEPDASEKAQPNLLLANAQVVNACHPNNAIANPFLEFIWQNTDFNLKPLT